MPCFVCVGIYVYAQLNKLQQVNMSAVWTLHCDQKLFYNSHL